MGRFDFFKKENSFDDDYKIFSDRFNQLKTMNIPDGIVAINFNLYEGVRNTYDIQLIGSDVYDESDEDWACSDYFTTDEDICYIKRKNEIKDWQKGLDYIKKIIEKYMEENDFRDIFKQLKVVTVGFVSGNLEIVKELK